jgi:WD40 repeat protein/tRNA A-37 threonylcarbamoyl transferase component Bud32
MGKHSSVDGFTEAWARRERVVEQFEAGWEREEQPAIEDYLRAADPERLEILTQLVHADLEWRLKRAEAVRVEAYLARYPELASTSAQVIALIETEYEMRRQREPELRQAEYHERFPAFREELAARLRDPSSERDTVPDAPAMQQTDAAARGGKFPVIPGFEVLQQLGRGGMGVVYKARQFKPNRLVALKMLVAGAHAPSQELQRFRIEAEAVARLQQPHIVQIHEVGEQNGQPYLVLEYVDGGSLAHKLKGTPLPFRRAAEITETLARAMHCAHQQGVVHRDLTPANVLLTADDTPKITDFGFAKLLAGSGAGPTQSEATFGTPSYMSPEQASGKSKTAGTPADVYGLGAILYEMLTGRPPFKAETPLLTVAQVVSEEPVPPRHLQSKVPRDLETICLTCLQKEPRKRYASSQDLADDLRRYLNHQSIRKRAAGPAGRLWRWCRRHPALAISSGLAAAALIAVAVVSTAFALYMRATLHDSQHRLATLAFDRGLDQGAKGEVGPGMHWFVRTLQLAPLGAHDLRRVARINLAGWRSRLTPLRAIVLQQAEITCVAFSRDGSLIATGSTDGTVRLWDAATGRSRVGPLRRHQGEAVAMAFNPDGTTLATGGNDGKAWLWDVVTGQPRFERPFHHKDRVSSVAFSPDGQMVVTGSHDWEVRLWEVASGQERYGSPLTHPEKVTAVAVSPDGTKVLTGCNDQRGRLWAVATGKQLDPRLEHLREVMAVAFSPNGEIVATGSADRTVQLWGTASGKPLGLVFPHPGEVTAVAFSPDGTTLLTGCTDNNARVWEVAFEKTWSVMAVREPISLLRHQGAVNALAFDSGGQNLLTASTDGFVRLWEALTARPLGLSLTNKMPAWAVAFSPDGLTAVIASEGFPECWEAATGRPLDLKGQPLGSLGQELGARAHQGTSWVLSKFGRFSNVPPSIHRGPIRAVVFSPDGRSLVTGGSDFTVRLRDRTRTTGQGGVLLAPPHRHYVEAIAFDGRTIVSGSFDHTGQVWDAATGRLRGRLPHDGPVVSVALSGDGRTIVTGSHDHTARLWNAITCEELPVSPFHHQSRVLAVAISPDGTKIATGTEDGSVHLWAMVSGKRLFEEPLHHGGPVLIVTFSPNGRRVLTASKDQTARLWDAATSTPLGPPLEHQHWVRRAVFSPDGSFVLTGSADGTARLWDTVTSKPCGPPIEHRHELLSAAFSPNGRVVLTGCRDRNACGRLTEVPMAVEGDTEQLLLWVQVLTGMELDDHEAFHALSADQWKQRKLRLAEIGGSTLR